MPQPHPASEEPFPLRSRLPPAVLAVNDEITRPAVQPELMKDARDPPCDRDTRGGPPAALRMAAEERRAYSAVRGFGFFRTTTTS